MKKLAVSDRKASINQSAISMVIRRSGGRPAVWKRDARESRETARQILKRHHRDEQEHFE
jgi:hypothetical protein